MQQFAKRVARKQASFWREQAVLIARPTGQWLRRVPTLAPAVTAAENRLFGLEIRSLSDVPSGTLLTSFLQEEAVLIARLTGQCLRRVPALAPVVTAAEKRLFGREVRRLYDVLSGTPLADRFWVIGGVLLGWAREGDLLDNDVRDIDFGLLASDLVHLRAATPALEAAGFKLITLARNNDGKLTVVKFQRSGIHFDFLSGEQSGDKFRMYAYFWGTQIVQELPLQELEPLEMFDRRWLKVKDHELELEALYGDWRTPKADWQHVRDCPAIIAREPHRVPKPRPGEPSDWW